MVVPDALSRAIEAIEDESFANTADSEYIELRNQIKLSAAEYPEYHVDKEITFHDSRNVEDENRWKFFVPIEKRLDILKECHDNILASHGGFYKTAARIRENYYWPKMLSDIAKYIRNCEVCKAMKPSNQLQQANMGDFRDPRGPFNMLALDFMAPFPLSKSGNRQLLVVIDVFSKYVWLHPMLKASAEETVKFLREHIFRKFGVPQIMISDNDPQLKSATFKEFLKDNSVEHWPTAFYHPQANPTEATNKTILNAIRAYINNNHREWDHNLIDVACAYNTAKHTITKYTSYSVIFGREMSSTGKKSLNEQKTSTSIPEKLNIIREKVAENIEKFYKNNKRKYDLRSQNTLTLEI